MTIDDFKQRIVASLGFAPTADQWQAMDVFAHFLADRQEHVAMVMSGSAGTGKTSLASAMVRTLKQVGQKLLLLAPTGRAAKVFALNSGLAAYTIHRKIYRERAYTGIDGSFSLNDNLHADTLFLVDESSMISNGMGEGQTFGSGCLLDDLMQFVYSGRNCRIMFIGDNAQLPPVGESESPAMSKQMIEGYGMTVYQAHLDEVVRQGADSGILYNATAIRLMATRNEATMMPRIRLKGFADVEVVRGDELIETLASSYSHAGVDDTIVITRSNKRAKI